MYVSNAISRMLKFHQLFRWNDGHFVVDLLNTTTIDDKCDFQCLYLYASGGLVHSPPSAMQEFRTGSEIERLIILMIEPKKRLYDR